MQEEDVYYTSTRGLKAAMMLLRWDLEIRRPCFLQPFYIEVIYNLGEYVARSYHLLLPSVQAAVTGLCSPASLPQMSTFVQKKASKIQRDRAVGFRNVFAWKKEKEIQLK